jgi:hypothetical protein
MTRATINKAENRALRKRYFKGKKIPAKSIQSNPPQFAASSSTGKNQPFREPQTWYTGFPVYQNEPGTSGYQRRGQQGSGCISCGSFQHGINVPSIQNPSSKNQKQTDMIKDEYFNINDCNNLSLDFGEISNLTHDHYEYEQAQGDIIVKSRLKKHYNVWKNIGCYNYILETMHNGYRVRIGYSIPGHSI